MLSPGCVTVCLSGGADSVALLRVLLELRERYSLTVAAVHVHHGIRGEEAERDEAFCEALCAGLNVPLSVRRVDVPALARESGDSLELAARKARYAVFEALHAEYGGVFATAHTLNDNAETVIHAFLRSRSPSSLCGIPPVRGLFVRPLLCTSRAQVDAYLTDKHIPFRDDATNATDVYTRNRIRHHVIPILKEINPAFCTAISNMTALLREDEAYLDALAERFIRENCDAGRCPAQALAALPRPIAARVVRKLYGSGLSRRHVEAVLDLAAGHGPSAAVDIGGATVRRV